MWLTVQIALWGTGLAVVLAVPFGLACARNVSPFWLQQPMRLLMNLLRSVPDLVVGTLFLVAVGLGPFAGVMAIAVNTGAVLAKLFSEAVEAIDRGPSKACAPPALALQEIIWGVIPQVAPLWTSYALYRFESSARSATVLGLIGAGGIGQLLFETLNAFDYQPAVGDRHRDHRRGDLDRHAVAAHAQPPALIRLPPFHGGGRKKTPPRGARQPIPPKKTPPRGARRPIHRQRKRRRVGRGGVGSGGEAFGARFPGAAGAPTQTNLSLAP